MDGNWTIAKSTNVLRGQCFILKIFPLKVVTKLVILIINTAILWSKLFHLIYFQENHHFFVQIRSKSPKLMFTTLTPGWRYWRNRARTESFPACRMELVETVPGTQEATKLRNRKPSLKRPPKSIRIRKTIYIHITTPGLPDGIFAYPKSQFWYILEGLVIGNSWYV
jgi:hypothetical protein